MAASHRILLDLVAGTLSVHPHIFRHWLDWLDDLLSYLLDAFAKVSVITVDTSDA